MQNQAIGVETQWTEDELTFRELIRQAYTYCVFSAGTVEGDPVDTLYLRLARGDSVKTYLLRPDEAAAIAWCLTGVLWSHELLQLGNSQ